MRKSIVLILLILFSCQKDELQIVEPYPQYNMIFEETESKVTDGIEISFETQSENEHILYILKSSSVLTKEKFSPQVGVNTKVIYTNTLPKEKLVLVLKTPIEEITTNIIIE